MATARFNAIVESAQAASAAVGDCQAVTFWDAAGSGTPPTGGNYLWTVSLSNNIDALTLGQRIQFASGQVRYVQNAATGESNENTIRKLNGMVAGGIYMQFHDSTTVGTAGTSNVMNLARVSLPQASWNVA